MQGNAIASSQSTQRKGHVRSTLSLAIVGALLLGAIAPAAAQQQPTYQEAGRIGDAASWRTEEFKADWGLSAIGAEYAYARGLTGKGVRLGVFDSGVNLGHGDFAGRNHNGIGIADPGCTNTTAINGPDACFSSTGDSVAVEYFHYTDEDRAFVAYLIEIGYLYDWVDEYLETIAGYQYVTHGTHVAGTMAANRDGNGTHGVAFGSDLTSARLFSDSYSDLDTLLGIGGQSYAIGPGSEAVASMYQQMSAQGVRAINHSWGLSQEPRTVAEMDALYASDGAADYFSTYINPSLRDGIIQVWAAGNGNGDIAGIYATLPRWNPELEKYWLSVVNVNRDGVLDGSSSICGQTMNWCVTAPGTDITSTVVGGDIEGTPQYDADGNFVGIGVTDGQPEFGYGDLTGTSMAAPHVTGALALLMERFPYLDNPQIRDILLTTATDLGAVGVDELYGWGLINLRKAIEGPGQLRVDTDVVMNSRAGGAKVWEGLAWDDWTNDISGPGRMTKSGVGWLRLSGDNSFNGATVRSGVLELDGTNTLTDNVAVEGGYLILNGSLVNTALAVNNGTAVIDGTVSGASTVVGANGRIGGTGTLADTKVFGTMAAGNGVGTLTIAGDYVQGAGSTFEAELAAGGRSDLLQVNGHASLQGGTLTFLRGDANQNWVGAHYNLLSATSLDGQFAAIDRSAFSPFLNFNLVYATNGVSVDVVRGQALASAGGTWNQTAVGSSVDAMADNAVMLRALTQLFPQQAQSTFDSLSGELHASTRAVLVDGSRHVRDAALARAQAGNGAFAPAAAGSAAWIEVLRNGGAVQADGNAGRVDYSGNTTLVGYDYRFENGLRLGALGGTGRSDLKLPSRSSEGDVNTRQLGIYAGQAWGGFGVRGGLNYARHDIDVERDIVFPGVVDHTRAQYDASSSQAFVEGGYRFGKGAWEVEPYAQVAHVRVDSDGFSEQGGVAALVGDDADSRANLSTLGLRFNLNLRGSAQTEDRLSLRGGIARRHASGDLVSDTGMSLAGGTVFSVRGASLAQDSTLVEAGFGARIGQSSLLEVSYSGMFADETRDHGMNARFTVSF
ncbi:autotransporter domain-containing protein [Montanilutibacter psychrotolerans]|uniref:Autotransporter domain-containing protein n=1 Tax=Montanilutibacter psychrotolerans TaxID=1327343 RepID=A0A3M8SK88_9GAMM|nr:autotransporter serine protease [Lysobacter psychrotolerans]RNF81701.1 autotransporter domain-containing protein [Lysobacter psychrotolerans]